MIYTISPDLLRNIKKEEGIYLTDVLFVFAQRSNTYKVTRDSNGEVLRIYESIASSKDCIKTWLDLMSFIPSPFEVINVDISDIECEETKFLKLCKETNGENKIIYYSKQNVRKYKFDAGSLFFEKIQIIVLDRDEARHELTATQTINTNIINSQVAQGNSQISKSDNK